MHTSTGDEPSLPQVGDQIRVGRATAQVVKPLAVTARKFPGRLYVGLTGGIGAGKSTVAQAWEEFGATVFSADQLAREVVLPGTQGLAQIEEAFGPEVINRDGTLNRAALGQKVFDSPSSRKMLEEITHPLIGARAKQLVLSASTDIVVYDVPLLVEANLRPLFDLAVVVDAPREIRLHRLEQRGLSKAEAEKRIAAQTTHEERVDAADIWIENDGTAGEISAVSSQVCSRWLQPVAAC